MWTDDKGVPVAVGTDLRVLGPLEAEVRGRVLELGGPRVRVVLAMLVAETGRVVSVRSLAEGLWGPDAPPDAERTVRRYVSRLRAYLGPLDVVVTRPPGYVLSLTPDAVDAIRFERLATEGRRALDAEQPDTASASLTRALALWRGEPYAEFGQNPALVAEGVRLAEVRLSVLCDRIQADLAVGCDAELIAELEALVHAYPGHERPWTQLITALYRAGRQADALSAFRRVRDVLVGEFGLEPSPRLAELHRQVLAHDTRLRAVLPWPRVAGWQ